MSQDPRATLKRRLPELLELETLRDQAGGLADVHLEAEVLYKQHAFPIWSFRFGNPDPSAPCVAFVGGVHGLERIGTNVVLSYLRTLMEMLRWDLGVQHLLSKGRLVFLPLLNPAGMYARRRSNANGVDLMRNAPIDAETKPNIALVGGHRISPVLPWYRGPLDAAMQQEAQTLVSFVEREVFPSRFAIALDLHSGFGLVDRVWYPYAYSKKPFDRADLMETLKQRLERALPNHNYVMEPQSQQYVTHGDLWDHLYLMHRARHPDHVLLPLTLEMGSWAWIKKNPRQAFSAMGIFNPILPHRIQRTLRRHHALLDFCLRAAVSHPNWAVQLTA